MPTVPPSPLNSGASATGLIPDWWTQRGYAHFDRRPSLDVVLKVLANPSRVARHAFWPFIQFVKRTFKYIRDPETRKRRIEKIKKRPIRYAAHMDSHIYAYYSRLISEALEGQYSQSPQLSGCVLAYRKFSPAKCNVHFAKEAFDEVRGRGDCDVVALDVEDFFGSLQHSYLKRQWESITNSSRLAPDHYAVFRAITRYAWVDRETLAEALGRDIPKKWRPDASVICSPQEFRQVVRPRLEKNLSSRGIPQGSPISATLANLYMLETDRRLSTRLREMGCSYRRYSDDILLIAPMGRGQEAEQIVTMMLNDVALSISSKKTMRAAFRKQGDLQSCQIWSESGECLPKPTALQYLGLTFDGRSVRLRSQTMARFLSKMRRGVRNAAKVAKKDGALVIRRTRLYRRFSPLGWGRRFFRTAHRDRRSGSFVKYAKMAARITQDEAINAQHGRQWVRLNRELLVAEAELAATTLHGDSNAE